MENLKKIFYFIFVYFIFYFMKFFLFFIFIIKKIFFKKKIFVKSKLIIESGKKGWEIIEYKELLQSAKEYLGEENVKKLEIDKSKSYVLQIFKFIKQTKATHYLFDCRTGSQSFFKGIIQSIFISIIFEVFSIVPICTLTDVPVRRWRIQNTIISSRNGIILTLMPPKLIKGYFPHNRIIGPMIFALSENTLKQLTKIKSENKIKKNALIFLGSLYEPRTTILNKIKIKLKDRNIQLKILGPSLGGKKLDDEKYWLNLAQYKMIITTADQLHDKETDKFYHPHLIYRYTEVAAVGNVLVAQKVPSIERYFEPDIDFIHFSNIDEAVNKISSIWNDEKKLNKISDSINKKINLIVKSKLYWVSIDKALGYNALK